MLIDTHCHIHDAEFYGAKREGVYARAVESGVEALICVGTSLSDSKAALDFAAAHENAYATIGVHPHDAKDSLDGFEELVANAGEKLVGIGEIGLDYYYNNSPREAQIAALEHQLQVAQDRNLPVSFHVRSAFTDFWPIFDSFKGIRAVLHSYTDDDTNLDEGLSRGLLIGVNGISTFTKDPAQQACYDRIPLDKLLLETDAPFLAPASRRGQTNQPAFIQEVAEYHAARRNLSFETLAQATTNNAKQLFSLKNS